MEERYKYLNSSQINEDFFSMFSKYYKKLNLPCTPFGPFIKQRLRLLYERFARKMFVGCLLECLVAPWRLFLRS